VFLAQCTALAATSSLRTGSSRGSARGRSAARRARAATSVTPAATCSLQWTSFRRGTCPRCSRCSRQCRVALTGGDVVQQVRYEFFACGGGAHVGAPVLGPADGGAAPRRVVPQVEHRGSLVRDLNQGARGDGDDGRSWVRGCVGRGSFVGRSVVCLFVGWLVGWLVGCCCCCCCWWWWWWWCDVLVHCIASKIVAALF
jgi:hypothetical protein